MAGDVAGGHRDGVAGLQVDAAALEGAHADLRTAEIAEDRDVAPERGGDAPHPLDVLPVPFVSAVGEVEPEDVDARDDQLRDHLVGRRRGPQRGDDAGAAALQRGPARAGVLSSAATLDSPGREAWRPGARVANGVAVFDSGVRRVLQQYADLYILLYMQQVIVELDDRTIARLNRVAPPSARKRSEFIREAIRRALNERLEQDMERAYRKQPQEGADIDVDPSTWEAAPRKKKAKR